MSETVHEPSEHHARFEPFVGTFAAKVSIWSGPGDPMVATGVMTNTLELGGRFLRQDYRGDDAGPFQGFEGRGYWGYNAAEGVYEGFWIDTASTIMQTDRGHVDGDGTVWTMEGALTSPTGETVTRRSVITLHDRDRHSMTTTFIAADGREHRAMEIEYTRTG